MVLAVDQHLERLAAGADPALQAACGALEDVLLAPAEQPQLIAAVERRERLAHRGALGNRADHLPGEERGQSQRFELAELVAVVGQQVLGRELQQDGVVAFERGEDVGVGPERGEPVGAQVPGAAACFATGLDVPVA